MERLAVIFRKESDGSILAVFPTEPESYSGRVMLCYAHVGQHGSCDIGYFYETKPATESEYAALYSELRGIYESDYYGEPVKLVPVKRISAAMTDQFFLIKLNCATGLRITKGRKSNGNPSIRAEYGGTCPHEYNQRITGDG